jgi:formylglycine-generating enzyme required for sulfatase activity
MDNYNLVTSDGSASGNISSRDPDKKRPMRGGSWDSSESCRAANRVYNAASNRSATIGFRVVCP